MRIGAVAAVALVVLLAGCGDVAGPPGELPDQWTALSAGDYHTCALAADGRAFCWGSNQFGQLGRDDIRLSPWPRPVQSEERFIALSSGFAHSCGVTTEGRALCWGLGRSGQLGIDSRSDAARPTPVAGEWRLRDISAGHAHTCGITAEGEGLCWGDNTDGQLGTGTTDPSLVPALIGGGGLMLFSLSAGHTHTCGAAWSGTTYCWGDNRQAQLGNASFTPADVPVWVHTTRTFVRVSAGFQTTCGLTLSGTPHCWGSNAAGQLGVLDEVELSGNPVPVTSGVAFNDIATGAGAHVCGITWAGEAFCWGNGGQGQLGDGRSTGSSLPVAVDSDRRFIAISPGLRHTCALTSDSAIFCWGQGRAGQLGNGLYDNQSIPVIVGTAG